MDEGESNRLAGTGALQGFPQGRRSALEVVPRPGDRRAPGDQVLRAAFTAAAQRAGTKGAGTPVRPARSRRGSDGAAESARRVFAKPESCDLLSRQCRSPRSSLEEAGAQAVPAPGDPGKLLRGSTPGQEDARGPT